MSQNVLWTLLAVLVILAILWLLGVRFDVNVT